MVARSDAAETCKPVYVLHGKDGYLRRMHLGRVTKVVLGTDADQMGRTDFDGPEATLSDVLDELRTLPLLAVRRLVVVREAEHFVKRYRSELERYLESPSETGILLLLCESWPRNTRLARAVVRMGEAIGCESPPLQQLPPWLVKYAAGKHGKKLPLATARKLVDLIGNDLGSLCGEVDKLASYVGDAAAISDEDVEELVGFHRQEKVFGIIDAAERGDLARALELWRQVLATDRAAPFRTVGGLAWALRRMAEQRRGQGGRGGRGRFSAPQLEQHLARLADVDQAAKTGSSTVQSAVEEFIVHLCHS